MKKILIVIFLLLSSNVYAISPDMGRTGITPSVQDWQPGTGTFALSADKAVIIVNDKDRESLATVASEFRDDLTPLGFPIIETIGAAGPKPGAIFLRLAPTPLEHGPESYTMDIGEAVVITGNSPAAVLYGTRSFLHMQRATNGKIPCGTISDWPDYPCRELMLDVARKPWPLAVLRDYIRMMAWYKMNELHLHLSDCSFDPAYSAVRVQSDVFPGLSARDLCYSKADVRELVAFARGYGVTITPEFDMPGHAAPFVKYFPDCAVTNNADHLDVRNPKTLEVMKKFVDEMIPLFDAPDFHIGTDEYRLKFKDAAEREEVHAAFRRFINAMNAHIRSRGKNCRIWSNFEAMGGKEVKLDPSITVDMWDPYNTEFDGHKVINSDQGVTYICPGAHYYGINPAGVYQNWDPSNQGPTVPTTTPKKGDPRLLGGALHVWGDLSPTGYTFTEIAWLTLPGIQAFSEKLWGTKGSPDYATFLKRADAVLPVPGVTVLDRLQVDYHPLKPDVVLNVPQEIELSTTAEHIELPLAHAQRADLEYPWTLTMEVMKTKETNGRSVLLSSDLVEVCANYEYDETVKKKDADGKTIATKINHFGLGLIRCAGATHGLGSPAESHSVGGVSRSFDQKLALNQWVTLTVTGSPGASAIYLDGKKIGGSNNQMVCPLRYIGSLYGQSFVGKIRNLKVLNRLLSDDEIAQLSKP